MPGRLIEQLTIGSDPGAWADAGFALADGGMTVGETPLAFAGEGTLGWRLTGVESEIDGLPVAVPAERASGGPHPNGATRIDHLVVFTPDLERTTGALEAIGVERRRVREVEVDDSPLRQGFFRL